jgi:hypothetical protein
MTTTPTKGYTLPAVGADFGTWGTELNGDWSILDNNLGGINSNSMASSSGGTYTVTSAAAQNVIQQMTGTITGNVFYQLPAQQGFWIIDNNCSGAYDIFVTSAGGGTSTLAPPGGTQLVWSDATNIMTFGRTILGQNLNLYVATNGSDSNNGWTSTGPFLTLQHALNVAVQNYDTQGYSVIINLASGTYTVGAAMAGPLVGGGVLQFLGNTTTPTNCVVALSGSGTCFTSQYAARMQVSGISLTASHTTGICLAANAGGIMSFDHCQFNAATSAHIEVGSGGYIQGTSAYTIAGNSAYHMLSGSGAGTIALSSQTVTLSGTPAFTSFCWSDGAGILFLPGNTWTGSATGLKYTISNCGLLYTGGAYTSLPGSGQSGLTIPGQGFIS